MRRFVERSGPRSCAGSGNEAHCDALARMAGRLQPREAEALSGEARCEGNGGGASDRGEVYFTAAKLSLVKHHYFGAFRCPFLPCSLFRRHAWESSISLAGRSAVSRQAESTPFLALRGCHRRHRYPLQPWSLVNATRTSIGIASSVLHASSRPRAVFELQDQVSEFRPSLSDYPGPAQRT